MKKLISILLAVIMLLSAAPLSGFVGIELPKINASAYTTGTYENLTYNEYDTYIEITKGDEAATTVVIPSKINNKPVTHISKTAFYAFKNLESVTIGDSVSSISANNFSHCTKLQKIEVSPDNPNFCSVDGVLFSKDKTELLDYPGGRAGEYNIPDTVVNITAEAFRGANITAVSFPDSVKSIGNSAFSSCYKLSSVALPESLILLDEYAFYLCESIESVTIGNGLEVISSDAFNGCLKLSSITIPDSVKLIGHEAFNDTAYYNNKDNWENGVLYIGSNLIEADYEITGEYTIKSGTKSISDFAFSGCQIQGIVIPDSVETIGESAFNGCSALNRIIIPSSVTSIGEEAFEDCSALTEINVNEKNTQYSSEGGVLFNKDKTVLVSYPIGSAAERYIIPSTVLTIEERAFYGCEALKSVCIGDGVTTISNSAFRDCTALSNIILPASLTLIDSRAFNSCDSLTTVNYKGSEEQWANITIESKNSALENATINYNFVCKHETTITIPGKAASCTETGFTVGENCSVCGEVTTPQKELDKLDHSYTVYVSTTPSTCNILGYKVMKCENCEATTNVALTEYGAHIWNEGEITTPANCVDTGVKTFTCTTCNDTKTEPIAIDENNHKNIVDDAAVESTCSQTGLTAGSHCTACNTTIVAQKEVAMKAHTETTVQENITDASCTVAGSYDNVVKCTVCHTEISRTHITGETLPHSYTVLVETVPSTCVALGHNVMKCENCEATTNASLTEYAPHTWNAGVITTNANCHAKGEKTFTCTACSTTKTQEVEVDTSNHDGKTEVRNAINATCKAEGYTGDTYCLGCDTIIQNGKTIAKLEHTVVDVPGTPATCSKKGLSDGKKCSVCEEIILGQVETPTIGHDYTEVVTKPTCTEGGYTTRTCKNCGHIVKDDETPAKGHTPSDWITEREATAEAEGLEIRKCTVCGEKLEERAIPKLTVEYMLGDINGDGKITASDARIILRIATKLEKEADFKNCKLIADVNRDDKITATDARMVLRVSTRLESF